MYSPRHPRHRKGMTIEMSALEAELDLKDLDVESPVPGIFTTKPIEELIIKLKLPRNIKVTNKWTNNPLEKHEYKIIIDVQGISAVYEKEKEEKYP